MERKAGHILVKDRSSAEDILRQIKKGASFESSVRDEKTDPC